MFMNNNTKVVGLMKTYNEILRDIREDRDLTQSDIAHVLKTTQQVYSRYEKMTKLR